jgi:hypothetical protein
MATVSDCRHVVLLALAGYTTGVNLRCRHRVCVTLEEETVFAGSKRDLPPREAMFPLRSHANGVPWLHWIGDLAWECQGCGAHGSLSGLTTVATFAHKLGNLKRAHAHCGTGVPELTEAQCGHPLNPDRIER